MRVRRLALAVALALGPGPAYAGLYDPAVFTLANGLTVVVVENRRAPVARVTVWYKAGGADDPAGKSGTAHYLEHLMFAGGFERAIAAEGGRANARTGRDYTMYGETVAADRAALALRLEADRMARLRLAAGRARTARAVVEDERRLTVDAVPAARLDERIAQLLYPALPYGRPVIGWAPELARLSAVDARAFHHVWYAPNNAVLVVAGAVDTETVRRLAQASFGRLPRRAVPARALQADPPPQGALWIEMAAAPRPAPLWRRVYPAPSWRTGRPQDVAALTVLAAILGNGPDALLTQALVRDDALATGVDVVYDPDRRGGSEFGLDIQIAGGVRPAQVEAAVGTVIERIQAQGLPPGQLDRAKRDLAAEIPYRRDSLTAATDDLGRALATGGTIADVEDAPARIAAVTADAVQAAAQAVLQSGVAVTGTLLPDRLADQ